MKSWLHNIAESYIYETPGTRRDLKEHYNLLTEEEKFALLSENALLYLDEQLKTAYGFGISDLTEEELGMVLQNLGDSRSENKTARRIARIQDPLERQRLLNFTVTSRAFSDTEADDLQREVERITGQPEKPVSDTNPERSAHIQRMATEISGLRDGSQHYLSDPPPPPDQRPPATSLVSDGFGRKPLFSLRAPRASSSRGRDFFNSLYRPAKERMGTSSYKKGYKPKERPYQ